MSISEVSVKDAELLAIEEINAAGGVMGKKIEPVVEDGASDWPTFAEKAKKLIQSDKVAVVFGCWTSASRKAVLPVFEGLKGLLFYPVQYEGLESSPNIFYTGATTNQQIVPSVEYLLKERQDEVLPARLRLRLPAHGEPDHQGAARGERRHDRRRRSTRRSVTPTTTRSSARSSAANPDVVYNTLNGDSNVAFFKQLKDAGITAANMPTLSVSIAEEEVRGIGADVMAGPPGGLELLPDDEDAGEREVRRGLQGEVRRQPRHRRPDRGRLHRRLPLGDGRREGRQSIEVDKVRAAAGGIEFEAPEGMVTVDGKNQHISKTVRIGKIRADGLIDEILATPAPVEPDPYLETYPWGG